MPQVSSSTGFVSANIAAGANMPIPVSITGYDLIQCTAATLGSVQIYNSSKAGTLMAQGSINTEAGAVSTVEFAYPIKCRDGANVWLESANIVVRYA